MFTPASELTPGVEYVITAGPGLRSRDEIGALPREFGFKVEPEIGAAQIASVEIAKDGDRLAIRLILTAPVSPLSIDQLQVIGVDGSRIQVERRIATNLTDIWLVPVEPRTDLKSATVEVVGLEDRAGHLLTPTTRKPR